MIDHAQLKDLLLQLVAIDSVNPSLVPGARGEAAASQFLQGWLKQRGIEARLQEAAPGRPNVVAWIGPPPLQPKGEKPRAVLALLAHIDTVGAGDMVDPFTPHERDGRLFGRGALDIKSGVAAMCAAAVAARQAGQRIGRPVLLAAVVDEECNSIGTEALLGEYTADAAIVLEPTDLKLVIAHKGYAWFEVITHGRAAHGSLPAEGRDAIRMMGRVLGLLDALDKKLVQQTPHPRLGCGSLHASLIRGGQELSSYPAECRLELERRLLPGESQAQSEAELRRMLEGLHVRDPEFRATLRALGSRPAYEIAPDAPVAMAAAEALQKTTGNVEHSGMAAWTDTALLSAAGIPGVVLGPSGCGLHGAAEYVELDSVTTCAEVLETLIQKCGRS